MALSFPSRFPLWKGTDQPLSLSSSSQSLVLKPSQKPCQKLVVSASEPSDRSEPLDPLMSMEDNFLEEVRKKYIDLPKRWDYRSLGPWAGKSLARDRYEDPCERALNEIINVKLSLWYAYLSLHAYFDRDNVAYKGTALFFKILSESKKVDGDKFIAYQNARGGTVLLEVLQKPYSEFSHYEFSDVEHGMEVALCLEKIGETRLLKLQEVAKMANDGELMKFVEGFIKEQMETTKKVSDYLSQMRRMEASMLGGFKIQHFDDALFKEFHK